MKKIITSIAFGLLGITLSAQVPSFVPTSGLVSAYVFNGNANNVYGTGTNGVVSNATLTTDRFGNPNSAYSFNGTNCSIDLGINSGINGILTDFTFSYWVYNSNTTNGGVFASYSNQNGSFWRFNSSIAVDSVVSGFLVGGGAGTWQPNYTPPQSVPFNTWSNITVVRSGGNMSTYINSILSSSSVVSSSSLNNPMSPYATTKIGFLFPNNAPFSWFNGKIDDIYFYNRALSQSEITNLFNAGICYQTITVTDTLIINATLTGFNPITFQNSIKIYPNPSNDYITIDFGSNYATMNGYTLKITNSLGQIVYTTSINTQQTNLNLSTWTGNGIYFVHLIDAQSNIIDIRKIVLQ